MYSFLFPPTDPSTIGLIFKEIYSIFNCILGVDQFFICEKIDHLAMLAEADAGEGVVLDAL
jgi:hypothetical protein